jgi:hypothetical protein
MKCLLIQTKDKRKFFTHEKNFIQLIEFSKAFNAEISIVKLEKGSILELEELAPAICDPEYKKTNAQYEVIETKIEKKDRSRAETLIIANKVKKHISEQFKKKNVVSLKEVKKKFKQYKLTDATLCNHIRKTKLELEKEGFEVSKLNAGQYRLKQNV